MEVRNIFVIVNTLDISFEEVIKDLKEEGYAHNFYFLGKREVDFETEQNCLIRSDEVWCFGHCEENPFYEIAQMMGKDIWIMA